MTDHPADPAWTGAWPGLRRKWLDEELTIERLVREAFLAGHDAKTGELRLAYSPEGNREMAAEPFRAKVTPFDKKIDREWLPGLAPGQSPEVSQQGTATGRFRTDPPFYPVGPVFPAGPPPVTRIDEYVPSNGYWPDQDTRVDQFDAVVDPGQPPAELFGPPQQDQRYAPTTTMAALPDDTNPGFRVPRQFEAVETVWNGRQADRG